MSSEISFLSLVTAREFLQIDQKNLLFQWIYNPITNVFMSEMFLNTSWIFCYSCARSKRISGRSVRRFPLSRWRIPLYTMFNNSIWWQYVHLKQNLSFCFLNELSSQMDPSDLFLKQKYILRSEEMKRQKDIFWMLFFVNRLQK